MDGVFVTHKQENTVGRIRTYDLPDVSGNLQLMPRARDFLNMVATTPPQLFSSLWERRMYTEYKDSEQKR
jgi:hypothetical protein